MADYRQIGRELAAGFYQFFCRKEAQSVLTELYSNNELLAVGEAEQEPESSDEEDIAKPLDVTLSRDIERCPEGRRTVSPTRLIVRSRTLPRKPRAQPSTLSAKIADINLTKCPAGDSIPLIVTLSEKKGKTIEIRDNTWQYEARYEPLTFRPSTLRSNNSVIRPSRQRSAYTSYRKSNYSMEIGRKKIFM